MAQKTLSETSAEPVETTEQSQTSPTILTVSQQQPEATTNGASSSEITPSRREIRTEGRGLVLVTFEDFWRMAAVAHASGQYSSFKSKEQVFMALQAGAELGLSPNQSLQSIAVINGKTSLYGDGLLAIVLASPLCQYVKEWTEGTGDNAVAICRAMRRGNPEPIERRFTMVDAKRAGLLGKTGPWQSSTPRMLQMRARAFCLRDGFADVLRGISVKEEVEDYAEPAEKKTFNLEAVE